MKVARILTRPNLGGPTRQAVALWHAHREIGVHTLLLVGRCAPDEPAVDLRAAGIPERTFAEVLRGAENAEGFCELPTLGRRIAPLRDLRAFLALRRLLRRTQPDVVHTHTSKAGVLGRMAAPSGAVRAHTFHGLVLRDYASGLPSRLARRVETRLAGRTDLLLAVSGSCRDELAELGVSNRVEVVPPAVATDAFAAADRSACRARLGAGARPAIGFVGRLVPIKRPELFVELAAALPQVDAFVLGDGPLAATLQERAPDNVHFLGARHTPQDLVPGLDLLVMPSRREGFPIASVEAAAAGVRTLGFDVPGLSDLAAFGGVATLVPLADGVTGLIEAARRLLALGPPPAGPGARALVEQCTPAAVAMRLVASYRAAMERRT